MSAKIKGALIGAMIMRLKLRGFGPRGSPNHMPDRVRSAACPGKHRSVTPSLRPWTLTRFSHCRPIWSRRRWIEPIDRKLTICRGC